MSQAKHVPDLSSMIEFGQIKETGTNYTRLLNTKFRSRQSELSLRRGQLLPPVLVLLLLLFVTIPIFAEGVSIIVETDNVEYFTDDTMVVSGYVENWKMPVVAMSIFDPDGEILSANNIEIDGDGTFTKIITLDSAFYDKSGVYLITVEYGQDSAYTTFDVIADDVPDLVPEIPQTIPKVVALDTDKKSYKNDDFITISGAVSAVSEPTVLIGIHNPDDSPGGFYIANIGPDLRFSTSFLAKEGVNFKTAGTYSVKAHYANTKLITTFDFVNAPQTAPKADTPVQPQIVVKQDESKPAPKKAETYQPAKAEPKTTPKAEPIPKPEPRQEPARQIEPEPRITDNLSVEDKELGIMLNEITLNCDASELADSIAYYDGMGPALMRLCKYDQAISYFDKALIENPERAEIYANKGAALSKMGQYEMAIAYYESALEIDPEYMPALNNKANALVHLGEIDKAITVYNSILEDDPTFSVAQNNLEKARAKYVELHKDETEKPEPVKIEHPQKIVQEPPEIKYSKEKEEKSIFDQIGSAFSAIGSGLFGFLS